MKAGGLMNNPIHITVFSEEEMIQDYKEQISAAIGEINNFDDLRTIHGVVLNVLINPGIGG